MLSVYKFTNLTVTLFTWTSLSHERCHLSEPGWIRQTNSQLNICMVPLFRGLVTNKNCTKKYLQKEVS